MHEIGILYEVVKQVEAVAKENNIKQIAGISLEVGEISGILPTFLEKYYPIVIEDKEIFKDSKLMLDVVPGEALCNNCKTMYNVMKNEGKCPSCQSRDKTILGGRDFVLKNVYVREENKHVKESSEYGSNSSD